MADIDRIIEQLLGSRRISEGAAFSSHTFTDQPIIERGRDFKRRVDEKKRREDSASEHEDTQATKAGRAGARSAERPVGSGAGRSNSRDDNRYTEFDLGFPPTRMDDQLGGSGNGRAASRDYDQYAGAKAERAGARSAERPVGPSPIPNRTTSRAAERRERERRIAEREERRAAEREARREARRAAEREAEQEAHRDSTREFMRAASAKSLRLSDLEDPRSPQRNDTRPAQQAEIWDASTAQQAETWEDRAFRQEEIRRTRPPQRNDARPAQPRAGAGPQQERIRYTNPAQQEDLRQPRQGANAGAQQARQDAPSNTAYQRTQRKPLTGDDVNAFRRTAQEMHQPDTLANDEVESFLRATQETRQRKPLTREDVDSFRHSAQAVYQRAHAEEQSHYQQLSPEERQLRRQLLTEEEALREFRRIGREPFWSRNSKRGAGRTRIVFRADAEGNTLGYVNEYGQVIHDTWGNLIPAFDTRFSDPHAVKIPDAIREMRRLEGRGVPSELAYGSSSSASLFYRQAKLMEDYEDDFPSSETGFVQYYPTYAAMSDRQLRSYFGWRTRVRKGQMEPAPLSFAFVHVYELLCGIGTTPGTQGLHDLRSFGAAYREANSYDGDRLHTYLQRWTRDYAIYHGIADEIEHGPKDDLASAVLILLTAEHAQLRAADREPRIVNAVVGSDAPTTDEIFAALGEASSYHIGQSRLVKDEPELLAQVATGIFADLVMHCSKRRKTDYVEGLFGYATNMPYTMYAGAVFYEEEPHPDCRVQVSPIETFTCTDGRWRRQMACEVANRSTELGLYMHEVDFELRKQLDYAYPLKQRKVPKYVERMVQKAVAACLKERAEAEEARRKAEEEAERRRIHIDFSKLSSIRAAAAVTQEALLTDEERGLDMVGMPQGPMDGALSAVAADAVGAGQVPQAGEAASAGRAQQEPEAAAAERGLQHPAAADVGGAAAGGAAATGAETPSLWTDDLALETPQLAQDVPAAASQSPLTLPADHPANADSPATSDHPAASDHLASTDAPTPAPAPMSASQDSPADTYGLSDLELRVLQGLAAGKPVSELLGPSDPFVSVVADSINEKLFDLVGDAVIEFDGDNPQLVEDYLDDLSELV